MMLKGFPHKLNTKFVTKNLPKGFFEKMSAGNLKISTRQTGIINFMLNSNSEHSKNN